MVEDWLYFNEEEEIEEEKIKVKEIGEENEIEEEGIGEGKIYVLEKYFLEEDLEFDAELEKANTKEREKKNPSREEVGDEAFAVESMGNKMVTVNE
jgi:hypothetical protein